MPHEWDSPEYVCQWIEDGDKTDPQRAEQITALAGLIRCSAEEPIEVLERDCNTRDSDCLSECTGGVRRWVVRNAKAWENAASRLGGSTLLHCG